MSRSGIALAIAVSALTLAPAAARAGEVASPLAPVPPPQGAGRPAHTPPTAAVALNPADARAYLLRARAHAERAWARGSRPDADRAKADAARALELDASLAGAHAALGLAHSLLCDHERGKGCCDRAAADPAAPAFVLRYRGIVLRRSDDHARAIAEFTAAVARDPRDFWNYVERAEITRDRAKALVDADRAVELAPGVAAVYGSRSWLRLLHRDLDAAGADARKAVELAPNDPVGHIALANVHSDRREFAPALASANKAVELAPSSAGALAGRADCQLRRGQPDLALADCRLALRADPCHWYAHQVAARALEKKQESGRALAACDDALRLYPRSPDFFQLRGEGRSMRRDDAGAAADWKEALRLDPGHVATHLSVAGADLAAGRHEAALASLDRAVAADPDDSQALAQRAGCLERLGRQAEADKCFEAALRLDRVNPYFDRGWVRLVTGNDRAGFADLQRGIDAFPDDPDAYVYRASQYLFSPDESGKALADAERAVRLAPESSDAHFVLAQCRDAEEKTDLAIESLNRALAIDPSFVGARATRARLLMEKERFSEALDDCDDALALDPDDADALAARANLFAILYSQKKAAGGNPVGPTAVNGPRPAAAMPRAIATPNGIRIIGGDPAWLAGGEDASPAGEPTKPVVQYTPANGECVAVVDGNGVSVFEGRTGAIRCRVAGHAFGTSTLAVSPDGRRLATAGNDGCIHLWDVETGTERGRLTGHTVRPTSLAWSADGSRLVSCHWGSDQELHEWRVWHTASGREVSHLSEARCYFTATFLPTGELLTAEGSGTLIVRDPVTRKALWSGDAGGGVTALRVSADGKTVAITAASGPSLWDIEGQKLVRRWGVNHLTINSPTWVREGRRVVYAPQVGSVLRYRLPYAFEEAVADATRAARLRPEWDEPLVSRGLCHMATERYGHARADFTRAIELNGKNPNSYYFRALVYIDAGDDEKALKDLNAAIGLYEKDADALMERGLLLLRKGEYREAKRDLDRAIELDPELKSRLPPNE
jgi:tetratricopeptide (TPR) repeat protein